VGKRRNGELWSQYWIVLSVKKRIENNRKADNENV
jgi:hypothetical protein